ncbi:MAG: hypothetical protein WCR72_13095 [Bacteroidota bacterium]
MKVHLFFISTILFMVLSQNIVAQKVILLQNPGTTKRILYHTGDKIAVRMGEPEFSVNGEITFIDDSVCTVNNNYTFPLSKVKEVYRKRSWFYASWSKLFAASVIYAGGSMINRSIHNEKPLIDNTIPIVSGSFVALGTASCLLRYRHFKMEDNWHLKVLDFDIFKEKKETVE